MMLNTTISGDGPGTPILLAHGLFGQGRNLGGIARRLDEGRRVISVDMRNHGDSFHDDDHSYAALADDLAQVIEANGGQADVIGHSMGGKAAMMLALTQPDLVNRLVVMDIAPVAYTHDQSGYIDLMEALDLSGVDRRSEADRRLAETLHAPSLRAFFLQSLDLKSQPPRWTLNLKVLRDQMDKLVGWPDDQVTAGNFSGPVLCLAGAQSDYVDANGEAEIMRLFPQAKIQRIEGADHWLHGDKPAETAEAIADFLPQD
ncbi:alpha/beta hydrolase [Paracoccus tegillarcae]|uniref:Alpha/beta hydrolase n=2 Tax=Paracoccus tegillarcae TaxID=1529068 RepID=A0A2K9EKA5_9RHOB|nr:alpha/beta fold hydrolase [Paracoccus tegillarcae]AUH35478.1 alpha/beta hydrolase [Paracoccus tegillarcae]